MPTRRLDTPTRSRRVCHGPPGLLCPSLRMLGYNAARAALDTPLGAHRHRGAFEICLITAGSVEWWAGERTYEVGPGEVYVTHPDEPHGGVNAVIQPSDLYWMILAPRHGSETARLLRGIELRHFPVSAGIAGGFRRLMAEHATPDVLSRRAVRAVLDDMLVTLARDHDAARVRRTQRDQQLSPAIRRAMAWMQARIEQDDAVSDAARVAGLSVTRFHERFHSEVGHSPADWRTRRRVSRARQLLRDTNRSVLDIAMRCGFASSQYFATTFKKMVGLTPRQYRACVTSLHTAIEQSSEQTPLISGRKI